MTVRSMALLALLLAAGACSSTPSQRARPSSPPAAPPAPAASAPAPAPAASRAWAFKEERAWQHLVDLCALGPRAHGMPGHAKAQELFRSHLRACGATPRDQVLLFQGSRDASPRTFTNVVGRFGPADGPWILIGTHYDSRLWADEDPNPAHHATPIAGANDSGSGTAVLLELATVLGQFPPPFGVELVFFDGEDYGARGTDDYFVGSRALAREWATHYPQGRPACAVVIDMVGDSDLRFVRESTSLAAHPWLTARLWKAGADLHPEHFEPRGSLPVTDDHTALLAMGIPSSLLIDFTYPHWHTLSDTLDKCSARSLGVTGRVLLHALVDEGLPAPPSR